MDFTVLASGSSGNASLLRAGNYGLMIDVGLGPRLLASRLREAGSSWAHVNAVVLSHVHADHWKEKSLRFLRQNQIRLFCHAGHEAELEHMTPALGQLRNHKLLHTYDFDREVAVTDGLRFRAFPLSHDVEPTCGFRIDAPTVSIGYATDLGCWTHTLAEALANVDVLAVEFNHDVGMERNSGREPMLIQRVLGEKGHLSNEQAADLVCAILRRSRTGQVRHLVQMHLSRHCNSTFLARRVAEQMLQEFRHGPTLHTAQQHAAGPILKIRSESRPSSLAGLHRQGALVAATYVQPSLPGWDD